MARVPDLRQLLVAKPNDLTYWHVHLSLLFDAEREPVVVGRALRDAPPGWVLPHPPHRVLGERDGRVGRGLAAARTVKLHPTLRLRLGDRRGRPLPHLPGLVAPHVHDAATAPVHAGMGRPDHRGAHRRAPANTIPPR